MEDKHYYLTLIDDIKSMFYNEGHDIKQIQDFNEHIHALEGFIIGIYDLVEEQEKTSNIAYNDAVNHPSHYTDGNIEVIDFIEDKKLGFHLGNAIKYIARAGKKDPTKKTEDIRKAVWYLERYLKGGRYE